MPTPNAHQESATGEGLPLVRASDLAAWAYCRRAWWLARVQGIAPTDAAPLEAGDRYHAAHGRALQRARLLRLLGAGLLLLGALLALAVVVALFLS